jgi:formamidopyrimidine-DNA glycosylase
MPELPEVETVRRGLSSVMEGARFTKVELNRPDLRRPLPKDFVKRLEGKTVTGLGRRAKYLLADLSSGEVLMMHLGMSGSFRVAKARHPEVAASFDRHPHPEEPAKRASRRMGVTAQEEGGPRRMAGPSSSEGDLRSPPQDDGEQTPGAYHHERSKQKTHDHVVFHMSSGALITFNDPRRFGLMLLVPRAELAEHPLMRQVGPEPLGNAFDAAMLARASRHKKTSLKAALSDQKVVAGLGNIYVCEALHRARLSPKRSASTLAMKSGKPTPRAEKLVAAIKDVLNDAIKAGGSSLRDHRRTDGELGDFQHNFRVYDREGKPCPTQGCRGAIRRIVQGGRSTFFCPVCQR